MNSSPQQPAADGVLFFRCVGFGGCGFCRLYLEDGIDSVYDEFGNGLVVLGGDTLSFVSTQGKEELSIPLQYSSPALSVAEDNMLAYDRGGHGLCLTNRYTALWQKDLESEIISLR